MAAAERGHLAARPVAVRRGVPRRLRARRRAWRSACWQVGGSSSPRRRVRAPPRSRRAPRRRAADDAERLVDLHAAALVGRQAELRDERVGGDAGRPHDGLAVDPAAVGEHGAGRVDRGEPVPVRISIPRLPSVRAAKRARPSGVWPRMRGAGSTAPSAARRRRGAGGGAARRSRARAARRWSRRRRTRRRRTRT